ncbi:MAG TPA: glycosyltransferase family 4 protein [Stellaceae bacterium]|nr:glycosyltransferase family 4 protein [Stellaceae bacterium]
MAKTQPPPNLLFLVTEDWYFCSHRLPVARAARDAGFAVGVATRVRDHGDPIRAEGFALHPLGWKRRGDGLFGHLRALVEIVRLYRRERPDLVYHVALKPVLFGGIAARLAGLRPSSVVSAVMGLGIEFTGGGAGWRRRALGWALRFTAGKGRIIVQNPENRAALACFGIDPGHIALIRGSGVDTAHFAVLPEPAEDVVAVALVGRMLKSKGVLEAAEAIRRLRAGGVGVELLLAGAPDPDSRDSLSEAELVELGREPGIKWLGHVADVREVWRRAAIAVLPSSYGEGVPKALLEAAACGRPLIASDAPGCREVVVNRETGILIPELTATRLAAVIQIFAGDAALRRRMGEAARARAVADFDDAIIAEQTLALLRSMLDDESGGR